jgi:hypothetical protein
MATWVGMRKLLPALIAAGTAMAATFTVYVETQTHARQLQVLRVAANDTGDPSFTARSMTQSLIDRSLDQPILPDFIIAYSSFSKRGRV